jgi:hypothetical protein
MIAQTAYDNAASCLTVTSDDKATIDCDDGCSVDFGAFMNHEFDPQSTRSVGSDNNLNGILLKLTIDVAVLSEKGGFSIPTYDLTAISINEETNWSTSQQEHEASILQLALYAAAVFISVSTMILVVINDLRLPIVWSQGQRTTIMPSSIVWAYFTLTLFACFTCNVHVLGYEHGGVNHRVVHGEIRGGAIYRVRGGFHGVLAEDGDRHTKVIEDLLKLRIIIPPHFLKKFALFCQACERYR